MVGQRKSRVDTKKLPIKKLLLFVLLTSSLFYILLSSLLYYQLNVPSSLTSGRAIFMSTVDHSPLPTPQPPFPRWGDASGIDFGAISSYLHLQNHIPDTSMDLLQPNEFHVPNLLYLFGGTPHARTAPKMGVGPTDNDHDNDPPRLWVANRRRRVTKAFLIESRYSVAERLLLESLRHLGDHPRRWPRLSEAVGFSPTTSTMAGGGVPLFVQLSDYRGCAHRNFGGNVSVPLFTLAALYHTYNCNYSLPLPGYLVYETAKRTPEDWDVAFRAQEADHPWREKKQNVIWRGANSGHKDPNSDKYLREQPSATRATIRQHMVYHANYPPSHNDNDDDSNSTAANLFDVGFVNVRHVRYSANKNVSLPVRDFVPFPDFFRSKAILDVDGNSWSSRFPRLLCSNSVVLKVEPEYVDYYHPRLRPWVHYVPVRMNSTDLRDVAAYVLDPANDAEMRRMVHNANDWCRENLLGDRLVEYTLDTIATYVDLLDERNGAYNWTAAWDSLKTEEFRESNGFRVVYFGM